MPLYSRERHKDISDVVGAAACRRFSQPAMASAYGHAVSRARAMMPYYIRYAVARDVRSPLQTDAMPMLSFFLSFHFRQPLLLRLIDANRRIHTAFSPHFSFSLIITPRHSRAASRR